ncbi:hypothetical protein HCN44_004917 [Aphidius gifuensis]|uniref:DNA-directed RNA polymerase III subunit RPC3 n=1 Tax=Aphidius gifuensis TaxID=684658 RepID=A0A834XU64_APHGI|nr:DNA-directed RNA polymerase III subunit RPC3 [Aphidius gifuensis]KAF7992573.1 hypothetical protein HCN44_004917 [Aphidius gifuensis]
MTTYEGKLCSSILKEHFGDVVKQVGDTLFNYGSQDLRFLVVLTKLPLSQVKKSLCVLIKFGIVFHEKKPKGTMYTLNSGAIIMMLRYSRFIHMVKSNTGDEAEIMLEEILKQGYELASKVIIKTHERIFVRTNEEPAFPDLVKQFELLTKNEYIMRCTASDEKGICAGEKPDYSMPKLELPAFPKLARGEEADAGDKGVYWRVNFDRFIQDTRDQLVVNMVNDQIDELAGDLMRQLLILSYQRTAGWSDSLNPVPLTEIREQVKKNSGNPQLCSYVDQYLRIIGEDFSYNNDTQNIIRRVGESSGGQYSINIQEAFSQLADATLTNIIMERFGSKAARLFSIVLINPHIQIEKIQSMMLVDPKDAKRLTFALLKENYIQMEEIKETAAALATSSHYLFYVNKNNVVKMQMEYCYQAIYNMSQRRTHEATVNKRVTDKYLRMQVIKNNLKASGAGDEQINEIDEMMTTVEYEEVERVNTKIKVLSGAEIKIEETLFILSMYLRYH